MNNDKKSLTNEELTTILKVIKKIDKEKYDVIQGATKIKQNSQGSIDAKELEQIIQNLDDYDYYPGVINDQILGDIMLLGDLNDLPEEVINLINTEQVGKIRRELENGIYTDTGYVVCSQNKNEHCAEINDRFVLFRSEDQSLVTPVKGFVIDDIDEYTIEVLLEDGKTTVLDIRNNDFDWIEKEKQIRCVVVEPGKEPTEKYVENELKAMQRIVGGNIEPLQLAKTSLLLCNEDGWSLGLKTNQIIQGNQILGTFLIVGCIPDYPEFVSLTSEECDRYVKEFCNVEMMQQTMGR